MTTKANGRVNSMALGWASLGYEWSKPIFVAYIRKSRFTNDMLKINPEFTVNIPYGEYEPKILSVCGSQSGRDTDKIQKLGLTLVESEVVSVPAIKEFPLTLECRVVCTEQQNIETIVGEIRKEHYPESGSTAFGGSSENNHLAFYGEIVSAYIIEP